MVFHESLGKEMGWQSHGDLLQLMNAVNAKERSQDSGIGNVLSGLDDENTFRSFHEYLQKSRNEFTEFVSSNEYSILSKDEWIKKYKELLYSLAWSIVCQNNNIGDENFDQNFVFFLKKRETLGFNGAVMAMTKSGKKEIYEEYKKNVQSYEDAWGEIRGRLLERQDIQNMHYNFLVQALLGYQETDDPLVGRRYARGIAKTQDTIYARIKALQRIYPGKHILDLIGAENIVSLKDKIDDRVNHENKKVRDRRLRSWEVFARRLGLDGNLSDLGESIREPVASYEDDLSDSALQGTGSGVGNGSSGDDGSGDEQSNTSDSGTGGSTSTGGYSNASLDEDKEEDSGASDASTASGSGDGDSSIEGDGGNRGDESSGDTGGGGQETKGEDVTLSGGASDAEDGEAENVGRTSYVGDIQSFLDDSSVTLNNFFNKLSDALKEVYVGDENSLMRKMKLFLNDEKKTGHLFVYWISKPFGHETIGSYKQMLRNMSSWDFSDADQVLFVVAPDFVNNINNENLKSISEQYKIYYSGANSQCVMVFEKRTQADGKKKLVPMFKRSASDATVPWSSVPSLYGVSKRETEEEE